MNKRRIEFEIDVYRVKIIMIIDKPELFISYISNRFDVKFDINDLYQNAAITHPVKDLKSSIPVILIFMKKFLPSRADYLSLLAHECIHATAFIFERLGEKINPNSEPFTYLFEHIFYTILTKLSK